MEPSDLNPRPARGRPLYVLACLLMPVVLVACSQAQEAMDRVATGTTVTSADEALEFEIPNSWSEESGLNEVAVLQAGDRSAEAYAVVIEDPREPFQNIDLGRFADTEMQELAAQVGLANLSGPTLVDAGEYEGLQYRLRGFFDSVEVVYLYTFIETPTRFIKVITWSLAERFDDNQPVLEQVAASVRELQPMEVTTVTDRDQDTGPVVRPQDPDVVR